MKNDDIRLKHILDSLNKIEQFASNSSRDDKTASAVLYELTIIGEAVRVLTQSLKSRLSELPWVDIVGMRNRIVHEYFSIDHDILWNTVEKDLPELKRVIENYLSEASSSNT
jgi:uncharacterized protein with HEPN domain